ncbi:protein FAR1-RELATED SEQUENCE 8-like isoform X1 [Primulina huaijiensis]|uniref:protein FAR1-RELATED SEQUENCE 8-like isoform X1 n=2 Tax=Primulina huaijiensis TaxID=1492673 RepID=UPI003CC6F785
MADDAVFSPADAAIPPNPDPGIELNVDGDEEGDELVDDEGEADFEFETNDLEHEDNQMLGARSNDLKNSIQRVFDIERNDLGDDGGKILSIDGGHMLEFGKNGHESNSVQIMEVPGSDHNSRGNQFPEIHGNGNPVIIDDGTGGKSCLPPAVGMEFESYDDAYNYYNCYSKELGFGIRVKSSWTKRSSKEKRGAVLCCNCEGFKAMKEASTRRKETRTGCPAMIRLRLLESNRWRFDEVKTEHNHLLDHERAQNSRSHKKIDAGAKRKLESTVNIEVQTIKVYQTFCADAVSYQSSNEKEISNHVQQATHLKLRGGDVLALYEYFHRAQLVDPNFFYVMDLSDEGCLKNVFWISSRSRAAYSYFGDVVVVDTTYLSRTYIVPLLTVTGLNHHGQSVLLGCGFVVNETMETYIWLMRAWLTCVLGRPPQTIITDKSKALCGAISVVFPRANHRLCLHNVMQYILEKVGEMRESVLIQTLLNRAVYSSMKVEDFEMAWEEMIQHCSIKDREWLRTLYEDRERWVPVYLKDTFFAGIYTSQPGEYMSPFFHGHLHEQTTWTEFFNFYELVQQNKIHQESLNDLESRDFRPVLRTSYSYELQLSEVYTKDIFLRFQEEVVLMANCCIVTQIHANGAVITYMVEERNTEGDSQESRNFEVMFDKVGLEVRCICSCFNFRGYLCRHALTVLNHNGVEEIPSTYILTRWRKDLKRMYARDLGSNTIDITNPVQWYDHLSRRAMQVVAEGITTQERYMVARQALRDSLNKVRLADKHV